MFYDNSILQNYNLNVMGNYDCFILSDNISMLAVY